MDNKQIDTLDEVLKNDKELQRELKKENKGNKKGIITVVIAVIAAAAVAASTIAISLFGKKNENGKDNTTPTTSSSFDLDDMGDELTTNSTTKTTYKVVSGNIDPNKIVEQNGKLYKDATEASKAQNKTTSINLKNDTLKTSVVKDKNGKTTVKVYDKTTGYEIKDETGKTVATGNLDNSGIPSGYAYDSVLKKYLPKNEVGKYVYADATYYDNKGNVVLKKGDVVLKETLEKAKRYFSITTTKNVTTTTTVKPSTTTTTVKNNSTTTTTTKPSTTTTTKVTTTTTSNEGVVNKDGTYTIFGLTFKTKADYQQWVIQGYEGYVEADGIMISQEELNQRLQNVK